MVQISSLFYVLIIFRFIFLVTTNSAVSILCKRNSHCPKYMCSPPLHQECIRNMCMCL
ncbi:late nodulin [Medicago truncatula]|uniref:Late nodulin n=2 Tax=Medicago truncatula TaxID=3880 RepID=A0A072V929_MEDTR|nr:late nodulin [Medicago truncatula]